MRDLEENANVAFASYGAGGPTDRAAGEATRRALGGAPTRPRGNGAAEGDHTGCVAGSCGFSGDASTCSDASEPISNKVYAIPEMTKKTVTHGSEHT